MNDLSSEHNNAAGIDPTPANGEREKLSGLSRGENQPSFDAHRYTKLIRSLKIILPLLALCIVAVLFTSNMFDSKTITPEAIQEDVTPVAGTNQLVNPRFDSVDEKNQPYTITAESALQNLKSERKDLTKPLADIVLNSGQWVAMQSDKGVFNQKTQKLRLDENVRLYHDAGYQFSLQAVDIDLKANTAVSDTQVNGHGPMGTLDAKGLQANGETEQLVFIGPAKLVLYDTDNNSIGKVFSP